MKIDDSQTVTTPLAAAIAFAAPRRTLIRPADAWHPAGSQRIEFGFGGSTLPGRASGRGPTVLLVHGWEKSQADMAPVAAALNAVGLRTVSFDLPAHGEAPGRGTHLATMSDAILAVADAVGPLHAVVGHSVGAAAATIALSHQAFAARAILLAPFASYRAFAIAAGRRLGLDEAGTEAMLRYLRSAGFQVDGLATNVIARAAGLGDVPCLVLLSRDAGADSTPGRDVGLAWPNALVVELDGHAEADLLGADEPLARMAEFLVPGSWLGTYDSPERYVMIDHV